MEESEFTVMDRYGVRDFTVHQDWQEPGPWLSDRRKDLPVSVTEYVEGHACRGKGCFRKLNAIFFEAVGTCHY